MSIITVTGAIHKDELGITSTHEHAIINAKSQLRIPDNEAQKALFYQKLNIENLGVVKRNPLSIADNHLLSDPDLAKEELLFFKKAGGNSIVEVTNHGIGRDAKALRYISASSGVNIIAGCGYYCYDSHPQDMGQRSIDTISSDIMAELNIGMDDTDIRAGVIGELGMSSGNSSE